MNLILDTCTLIWLTQEPENLSKKSVEFIDSVENKLVVSTVTVWEMALKLNTGKLELPIPLKRWLQHQKQIWGFTYLNIKLEHILRTTTIANLHKDPFDRLLICQAMIEDMSLVSPDEIIKKYPIHVIW